MTELFDHKQDVIFTSQSLMAFINKIHTNIRDNYCFVSTTEMANKDKNKIEFNDNEKEIAKVFSDWKSTYIAKICVINKEFPLTTQSSLRYTWLQGGSSLKFDKSLTGFNKQNRPIGTFCISENNDNQIHIVQINGFENSNFDNSNASGNNNNSISTNIIYADVGEIDEIKATEGQFTNITVLGDVGKLKITNTEEAKRQLTSANSFKQITPTTQYCNINIKITDTSKTFYKLDSKTLRSGTSSNYNYKISSIDLKKNYSLDTVFVTYKTGWSYNDTVTVDNKNANWGTITIEYPSYLIQSYTFKDQASAQLFYTEPNKESQCKYIENDEIKEYDDKTTTLYQWIGADPAAGIDGGNEKFNLEGSIITDGGIAAAKSIKGYKVHGSVFNDYAEFRHTDNIAPGKCVIETGNGDLIISTQRLQLGANIVSDTYGFSIGETLYANTPIAVCGRVLAYTFENRNLFKPGEAVCSGPDGTISRMTREEIRNWPDAIVGYVSEVPQYDKWGSDQVEVNGRIWIKVK